MKDEIKFAIAFMILVGTLWNMTLTSAYTEHKQTNDLLITINENTATACNISSMESPTGLTIMNNVMTKNLQDFYISINKNNFTNSGDYCFNINCQTTDGANTGSRCYGVNANGNEQDKGFTETAFYIGIAIVIAILVHIKISKFFGSFMIMVIGFGILRKVPQNGWIGLIVAVCGFLMLLYALVDPKKKRRY